MKSSYWCCRASPCITKEKKNPERIEWFIDGKAFSRSYDLAHRPPPSPLSHQLSRPAKHRMTERDTLPTVEWGRGGEEPNHTTAKSLVLYKSFNTLWGNLKIRKFNLGPAWLVTLAQLGVIRSSEIFHWCMLPRTLTREVWEFILEPGEHILYFYVGSWYTDKK